MPSNHLILCRPLLLCPQSVPASWSFQMSQLFASGGQSYWSFSFSISPSNSGLISFRVDHFDLLVVQGTFRSLLQHHSSKASNLWCSAFFTVPLSQPHVTSGKTRALTYVDLCWQSMSLFFNTLSRFVIAFLSRSNRLLRSWLQSPSTVILEPKKRKSVTMSTFSLIFAMKLWGQMP